MLSDFHGGKVVVVGDGDATISFVDCTFERNHLNKDTPFDGDHAIINAIEWTDPEYTLEDDSHVLVRLISVLWIVIGFVGSTRRKIVPTIYDLFWLWVETSGVAPAVSGAVCSGLLTWVGVDG